MQHVRISNNVLPYPMPMVLVSSVVEGRVNHMAVAWITRANLNPPMFGVALGKRHYTNRGIRAHGEFGVSVPSTESMVAVDHMGIVSGAQVDKARAFEVFYGKLENAPLVSACPLAMACRLTETVELPSSDFFIGEVVEVYCGSEYLEDGNPDMKKVSPFLLTMPDNRYWSLGEHIGDAWSVGKSSG